MRARGAVGARAWPEAGPADAGVVRRPVGGDAGARRRPVPGLGAVSPKRGRARTAGAPRLARRRAAGAARVAAGHRHGRAPQLARRRVPAGAPGAAYDPEQHDRFDDYLSTYYISNETGFDIMVRYLEKGGAHGDYGPL